MASVQYARNKMLGMERESYKAIFGSPPTSTNVIRVLKLSERIGQFAAILQDADEQN